MTDVEHLISLLNQCGEEGRKKIFALLQREFPIHQLERDWNVDAARVLEAISRAGAVQKGGVRGLITEATFMLDIVPTLSRFEMIQIDEGNPYDCLLRDKLGEIRIQIKMQRQEKGKPMLAHRKKHLKHLPKHLYVVETQKTRGGKNADGTKTRPYRFGEFDILGVCLHSSTNRWQDFVYTVGAWLLPHKTDIGCIATFQPVSPDEDGDWTRDLLTCIDWFRQAKNKQICAEHL